MPQLALPDPPLTDGVIRLRSWRADDADATALAAAWSDAEIVRTTMVPPLDRRTVADAARWIAGAQERRERGLALDLVAFPARPDHTTAERDPSAAVLGEVGLGPIDWTRNMANVGWWVAAPARGRGVATRTVTLLARWAASQLGLHLVAAVGPTNTASARVAANAGIECYPPISP